MTDYKDEKSEKKIADELLCLNFSTFYSLNIKTGQ